MLGGDLLRLLPDAILGSAMITPSELVNGAPEVLSEAAWLLYFAAYSTGGGAGFTATCNAEPLMSSTRQQ